MSEAEALVAIVEHLAAIRALLLLVIVGVAGTTFAVLMTER